MSFDQFLFCGERGCRGCKGSQRCRQLKFICFSCLRADHPVCPRPQSVNRPEPLALPARRAAGAGLSAPGARLPVYLPKGLIQQ